MLKIRRSCDRLIFNMGIPISGKDGLYIETRPRMYFGKHCSQDKCMISMFLHVYLFGENVYFLRSILMCFEIIHPMGSRYPYLLVVSEQNLR